MAIDPGNEQSAWVMYDTVLQIPQTWAKEDNERVRNLLIDAPDYGINHVALERIASYGMAVGAEIFETAEWCGRFMEISLAHLIDTTLVYRREVKLHLCESPKAKDTNVRQAIIDRYGPGKDKAVGRKAKPGPLYGFKADCWQALGVALTAAETRLTQANNTNEKASLGSKE